MASQSTFARLPSGNPPPLRSGLIEAYLTARHDASTYRCIMKDGPLLAMLIAALICFCCGRESEAAVPELRDRIEAAIEAMPRSRFDDETRAQWVRRRGLIVHAIVRASETQEDVAALLTIGQVESHWADYVQAGCHYPDGIPAGAGHCDEGTSRSPWQMKVTACRLGWALPRGSTEALMAFAVCARKRFRGALRLCHGRHPGGPIAGAFAGYRKSTDCRWEGRPRDGARARARTYQRRLWQLGG